MGKLEDAYGRIKFLESLLSQIHANSSHVVTYCDQELDKIQQLEYAKFSLESIHQHTKPWAKDKKHD